MRYGKDRLAVGAVLAGVMCMLVAAPQAGAHEMTLPENVTVPESAGVALVKVNRTGNGTTPYADYRTVAITATAGADYTEVQARLTFGPSDNQLTFAVPILDDAFQEGNETVKLELTGAGPSGDGHLGPIATRTKTLTIVDDDSFSAFTAASYAVQEDAGTATIGIVRTGILTAPADTVAYATSALTATAGADYTDVAGTATFAPGEVSKSFDVPILEDQVADEGQESVKLTLSNPSAPNHHLLDPSEATLFIGDNEAPTDPTPTVTSPNPPSGPPVETTAAASESKLAATGTPVAVTAVAQSAARRGTLGVAVACRTSCSVAARGFVAAGGRRFALSGKQLTFEAGDRGMVRLRLTGAARAAVRRVLALGGRPVAKVTIVVQDGSGTKVVRKSVRLVG